MTTMEDSIASHLSTNWVDGGGTNPKPTIGLRLDTNFASDLSTDNIMIDSRTRVIRVRIGAQHVREEWYMIIQVAAKTTSGSTSTLKDRLDQMITETTRILDRHGNMIANTNDHYITSPRYLSVPGSSYCYAELEFVLTRLVNSL